MDISKPESAVLIAFKHEGEARGNVFGPAYWVDADGNIVANVIDSDLPTLLQTVDAVTGKIVPTPDYEPEWMYLSEVHKVAKHFGVEIEEH